MHTIHTFLLMCLSFHIRVAHSQVHLVWAPNLDAPKSVYRCPNGPKMLSGLNTVAAQLVCS